MPRPRAWAAFGALAGVLTVATATAEPDFEDERRPLLQRTEPVNITIDAGSSTDTGISVEGSVELGGIVGIDLSLGLPYICKACDKLCGGGDHGHPPQVST
jgi:hypothetical protein